MILIIKIKNDIINTDVNVKENNKLIRNSILGSKLNKKEKDINLFFENLKKKINQDISDDEIFNNDEDELEDNFDNISFIPINNNISSKKTIMSKNSNMSKRNYGFN